MLVNRDAEAVVRLGTVTLTELDDVPPPPALREPDTSAARTLGLYLDGPHALDPLRRRIGPGDDAGDRPQPGEVPGLLRRVGRGGPRGARRSAARRALEGQAEEDSTGPDRLEILRRVLERQACSPVAGARLRRPGALPGLPPPDSAEAVRRGLVRLDGQGRAGGLGLPSAPSRCPRGHEAPGRRGAGAGRTATAAARECRARPRAW